MPSEDGDKTPRRVQSERKVTFGKEEERKLTTRSASTRSVSTDDEIRASPVFGEPARRPPALLLRAESAKTSLASPSLFDEEDRQKAVDNEDLNDSVSGLNVKRRSSRRRATKVNSQSPVDGAKQQKVPLEFESPCRDVLKEVQDMKDVMDLDETKSPSVISGKIPKPSDQKPKRKPLFLQEESATYEQQTATHCETSESKNVGEICEKATSRKDASPAAKGALAEENDLDASELNSPSVLTGKTKTTKSDETENQWLRCPREVKTPDVKPLDNETDTDDEVENMAKKATRKQGKNKSANSSPMVAGKKLIQSKLSDKFFTKSKMDLTVDPNFNGGKLQNSYPAASKLTLREQERLEIEEALKRSMEDQKGKPSENINDALTVDGRTFSEMTGPSFTSTPFVVLDKVDAAKNSEDSHSEKVFKKPSLPVKQAKTPKRNKSLGELDSSRRRSPRINKAASLDAEKFTSRRGSRRSSHPRKQLDLDTEADSLNTATSDLNGSVDPNVR